MPLDIFQPRSEADIGVDGVNALIAQDRQLSDLSRSASVSILYHGAITPEVVQLYAQAIVGAEGFYISSSSGAVLDRRMADFGLSRRAATTAYGTVTLARDVGSVGDIVVPDQYIFRATAPDGTKLVFKLRGEQTIPDGSNEIDVLVDADNTGAAYNVGAGAINELQDDSIPDLASVTNARSLTTGLDEEDDEAFKTAFHVWREGRRAGTPISLILAAERYQRLDERNETITPVLNAAVREYLDAPGPDNVAVDVLVVGHNGTFVSAADQTAVQEIIDGYIDPGGARIAGWRAAGIKVRVLDAALVAFSIEVQITLSASGSQATIDRYRNAARSLVDSLPIRSTNTTLGEFKRKALYDLACTFGDEIANITIVQPPADVLPAVGQKLTVEPVFGGVLDVSEA